METLSKFNSKEIEERILAWWEKEKIYEAIKAQEPKEEEKKFLYLDGPPYTTGDVHLGTAWNKILKDYVIKYKRMQGFRVTDTPGYDTHGLPIEVLIEKKLGIKNKQDIFEYGLAKFVKECRTFAVSQIDSMNQQFSRLGCNFWNWGNPYITLKNTYIQGVWWTIKKAWENGYLYQGFRPQNCCPRCATALAKHEFEYHDIKDTAIFVKFRSVEDPKTFYVIWTTTPWTLVSNTNIMANPDSEYVKMRVKDEYWIMGIAATADLLQNKLSLPLKTAEGFEYGERYTGYDLEGKRYIHPLADEIPRQAELEKEQSLVHTIVLSREYVQETGGSGLVHSAPGHGPEDFEVGMEYGIPIFSPVKMDGCYSEEAGERFNGKYVHDVNREIMDLLKEKGTLVHEEPISHEYAHCWRCKTKLVYRATKQWFFKTSELREELLKENEEIYWIPKSAGANNFKAWLSNLNDWCISRQRIWGIPLSIWQCDGETCENMDVIGSMDELKEKSGECPDDLHIPVIDHVTWQCPKCSKGTMRRVPDLADVWLDSGSVFWASQQFVDGYEHYDTWEKGPFILEGKDQIRGWFNSLLCSAMVSSKRRNYDACFMHGFVNVNGIKMSKSLENAQSPAEIIDGKVEILSKQQKKKLQELSARINTSKFDKTKEAEGKKLHQQMLKRKKKYLKDDKKTAHINGIEAFRFFSVMASPPGRDFNFDYKEYIDVFRTLNTFWNVYLFAQEKMELNQFDPKKHPLVYEKLNLTDKWMLAKTNVMIKEVTDLFEKYYLPSIPEVLQDFILNDLSRWYVVTIRDMVDLNNKDPTKYHTMATLWYVLYRLCLVMAPVTSMLTEELYQKMFRPMMPESTKKSVHLEKWPKVEDQYMDEALVENMDATRKIIDTVRSLKGDHKIKLRWPTKSLVIVLKDGAPELKFDALIKEMSNVKELKYAKKVPEGEKMVTTSIGHYDLVLDLSDSKELQQERILADLLRALQNLRKQARLQMGEDIHLVLSTMHPFLKQTLEERLDDIAKKVFAKPFKLTEDPLTEEEGWTIENFYVCVHEGCYSMIRAKNAVAIQEEKKFECRYCNQNVTLETLGNITIKFQKK